MDRAIHVRNNVNRRKGYVYRKFALKLDKFGILQLAIQENAILMQTLIDQTWRSAHEYGATNQILFI
ncbi:hypothetical protein AAULR_19611 [Lacticaseibacillus rhamnosus MTCC 5462]|nr:hypothetical protein AAULR_19611 [Lacticaseibacillus rhamnosus MTCC 5462]